MNIISISVASRIKEVPEIQKILTKYGKNIISRLGLHNIGKEHKGLIVVVYEGENIKDFISELKKIDNVKINDMEIN